MAQQEPNKHFQYLPSGADEVNQMIQENSDLFSDSQCKVCSVVLISESQKLAHYQSKKHASKVRRYLSIHGNEEPFVKRFKSSVTSNVDEGDKYKACHVCNMTFNSPVVAQSHYLGKIHSKNLRLKNCGQQTPASPQPEQQVKKDDYPPEGGQEPLEQGTNCFCSICNTSFNSRLMAQHHYEGKKHKKHLAKQMPTETYGSSSAANLMETCGSSSTPELMETYGSSSTPELMETYGSSSTSASTPNGYPCTVCNIKLNSVEQYQEHIRGSKHKNNAKLKNPTESPNDFQFTPSQDAPEVSWCGGKLPQSPATSSSSQPKAQVKKDEGSSEGGQGPVEQDPNRFCSKCKTSFNSPYMAQLHYEGKKHKKHLTKQNLKETSGSFSTENLTETCGSFSASAPTQKSYPCTVCNIKLNSVEQYQEHIRGSKHKNNVKLKKGGKAFVRPTENFWHDFQYSPTQGAPEVSGDWDINPQHSVTSCTVYRSVAHAQLRDHNNIDFFFYSSELHITQ